MFILSFALIYAGITCGEPSLILAVILGWGIGIQQFLRKHKSAVKRREKKEQKEFEEYGYPETDSNSFFHIDNKNNK